jgi:hypothetical protein
MPDITGTKGAFLAVLIIGVLALFILGAGLVLGIEPRMAFERTAPGVVRVTGSNHFVGRQFFSKTIEGVTGVQVGSAARENRNDSQRERQRRQSQKHVEIVGSNGARLGWDREDDCSRINEFIRGQESTLLLQDPPPLWRMSLAWFAIGLAILLMIGAVQSNFFPKRV